MSASGLTLLQGDGAGPPAALWCIVPAAGRGQRFGAEVPKQYLPLAGVPMILRTLQRLAAHPRIAGLMVVLAPDDALWPRLNELEGKPLETALGGRERADSVLAGLRALPHAVRDDDFVLVHDAARPCVRARDMSRLIERAGPAGGGILAAPLRDTVKLAAATDPPQAGARIARTVPRAGLWRALTPQMFRRGELTRALQHAHLSGGVTDEAAAMEAQGHQPALVEGAEDNIKVTTPADLALAEFLLPRTAGDV
ncbi:MAG: 2-C-methyl-D-erythritol 4-phosphate cytidylyltransferase [Lysobacterales bacterium]